MLLRLLAAVCGALVITAGLFVVMETLTSLWRNEERLRVFRIDDVLLKPEPNRPARPAQLERQPELPDNDFAVPASNSLIDLPEPGGPGIVVPPPAESGLAPPRANPSQD